MKGKYVNLQSSLGRLGVTVLLCALVLVGMGCARPLSTRDLSESSRRDEFSSSVGGSSTSLAPNDNQASVEVVCWGDSLTAGYGAGEAVIATENPPYDASGQSYPDILHHFTGLPTYNFGVVGATSKEIAAMQGGLVVRDDPSFSPLLSEQVVLQGRMHRGDILVIEMGSNGGWSSYDELIAQYRGMLSYARCEQYIILGDTDDPGTSLGDPDQKPFEEGVTPGETAWEAALREAFGDHFINMRAYLIEYGLSLVGLTPTEKDMELLSHGCVPEQLRSDWTHLNSYGYYVQARAVYDRGVALGYWG